MTDDGLLLALRDCYDPMLNRNIVDLGLVKTAKVREDRDAPGAGIAGVESRFVAEVTLHASSTDEAASAQLCAQVENRLAGMREISRVSVTVLKPLLPILQASGARKI